MRTVCSRLALIPAVVAAFAVSVAFAPPPALASPVRAPERTPERAAAPAVPGRAAYLLDATTGEAVYAKQANRRMPVASLTKVMTAYVVLREADPAEIVRISAADVRHAAVNGATHASLRKGERLTVRDLLYALMLPSGADAAHALATRYGPGTSRFVAKMNATARALGLRSTRYTNADGLPSPGGGGYSTAADQVHLARIALGDSTFRTISAAETHTVPRTAWHRAHTWRNSNKLLGSEGALGVKTGYTRAAGYCLLFAADRGDSLVIGAILGDTSADRRFTTARRLLDWYDTARATL
ncbi:D-alanyl-D-alanine carboxypeptidase (penicillin-binding protein 5/6) [Thermocatellispora tengchongensis]|uniref:D-alanyl-D-alanine carboxypeptidase (Penicillin-binding protein 5/6) n=1 Tax=Thermocatellispora tengchongensis TaxID=1073253 RepID=A0A840PBA1_9ACTN|nr:serine hydrolase [Thermocatellispora tengchongensis]MBB5136522.1 D-alanyl-D-alanine carboxypeptidase (penicillin-binding protein 5/6) [Thermocatellispora tengchongensis]